MEEYGKSSFGFDENIVAAAAYVGPLGLYIYFKEKTSDFVRYHATQSSFGFGLLMIFWILVKFVGFLFFLRWAPGLIALSLAIFMMLKAYDGEEYKLPIIGKLALQVVYETKEDFLASTEEEPNNQQPAEG